MAETFRLRGLDRAMVVHSADGLDELSPPGRPTPGWSPKASSPNASCHPADFGLPSHPLESVRGGDPVENAGVLQAVVDGADGPVTDFVLMSASAALVIAGAAPDFLAGTPHRARCHRLRPRARGAGPVHPSLAGVRAP